MGNKLEIGKIIKIKRLQLDLRTDDVARAVGISRATLCSIENGSGNYSIDILLKLLDYLNVSICFEAQEQPTRQRATKINSNLDKQINRFIVMCIAQYASYIDKGCKSVYIELKKTGIIDELIDDYEDMHGKSTYSINEYIDKRLSKLTNSSGSNVKHVLSKTILTYQTIELIAKYYKISIKEARDRFYESNVIEMLDDDETGLYGESALYLLSLYENQLNK